MKKLLLSTITVLGLSVGAASAATVTIDFDNLPDGFIGPADSLSGLSFDRDIQILAATSPQAAPGPGQTGQIARQSTRPFGSQPRGQSFGGSFSGFTVSSLSIIVGDSGGDEDIFRLFGYDASGAAVADSGELKSIAAIPVGISGTGIASFFLFIEDTPVNFAGSSFFDNVVFDTEVNVVPLPATLPLISIGLAALGLTARRRKS